MAKTPKPSAGSDARVTTSHTRPTASAGGVDAAFDAAESAVIGKLGAARLAALSGVPEPRLAGQPIASLKAKLGHVLDPRMFFMQRVCGKVVRTDASTGRQMPVPLATVQVEDTDCSLFAYHPVGSQWSWLFPFNCRREVIATVKTDACGRFCVWIPRFDIDWVLRWRTQRLCFPVIFERPNWRELLDDLRERIPELIERGPRGPVPGPDPLPDFAVLQRTASMSDSRIGEALTRFEALPGRAFGEDTSALEQALDAPAALRMAPPLPADFLTDVGGKKGVPSRLALDTVAAQLRLDPKVLEGFDPRHWIGPMRRCVNIRVPEWAPIIDVPDITFRVLQDVDGDGVEEVIYGERHFEVRWNAGNLPFVTLEADPSARVAPDCVPDVQIPCGNVPAIVTAGRLPLTGDTTTFDSATGYNLRTNRPHPSGTSVDALPNPAARSPTYGKLSLFGCHRTHPQATHYRVLYRHRAPGSMAFGPQTPFVGVSWWLYRLNAAGVGEWHAPTSNATGWYPINLPGGPNPWLPSEQLLLDWPTGGNYPDGTYELALQVGTLPGAVLSSSAPVAVVVDNRAPGFAFDIAWRKAGDTNWLPIGGNCPVVRRGALPVAVEFRVTLDVHSEHFRNAYFHPTACGNVGMVRTSGSGGTDGPLGFEHWHTSVGDQGGLMQAVYTLPANAAQGTYGFFTRSVSRAFDTTQVMAPPTPAFEYEAMRVYQDASRVFAVFNAD
ncbi:hypothetical protein [Hydrogenophaga sp.]|uniref:hypothetical protein n=1 Tax=Hydrogenophaga sp. TaxID=1904254 RepID=UPI002726E6B3|nr:hypothetical protein [Hydrogenophaga sp.]MDO8903611.1 hypothetical protein [Hydrogenophaga sp.]